MAVPHTSVLEVDNVAIFMVHSEEEIRAVIRQFKSGKASGEDMILAELLVCVCFCASLSISL